MFLYLLTGKGWIGIIVDRQYTIRVIWVMPGASKMINLYTDRWEETDED